MDKPQVPKLPPEKVFDALPDERKHSQTVAADSAKLMFQSVISSGENAVKSAMLINGGASVAVLAFLGNLMAKASLAPSLKLGEFPNAMLCFVFGVLVPALANGLIYSTQFSFKREWRKRG